MANQIEIEFSPTTQATLHDLLSNCTNQIVYAGGTNKNTLQGLKEYINKKKIDNERTKVDTY